MKRLIQSLVDADKLVGLYATSRVPYHPGCSAQQCIVASVAEKKDDARNPGVCWDSPFQIKLGDVLQ